MHGVFRSRSGRPRVLTLERVLLLIAAGVICYLLYSKTPKSAEPVPTKPILDLPAVDPAVVYNNPVFVKVEPYTVCQNAITQSIPEATIREGINKRFRLYEPSLIALRGMLNREMNREGPLDPCTDVDCKSPPRKGWMGLRHDHERWAMMGDPVIKCPNVRSLGRGDEEKRFCWSDELASAPECVVFSIGSNNLWGFERSVALATKCKIYSFDCTVDALVPPDLKQRVTFFKACLGARMHGPQYYNLAQLAQMAGVKGISFLKMDIEVGCVLPKTNVNRLTRLRASSGMFYMILWRVLWRHNLPLERTFFQVRLLWKSIT
jgi:hypothetical protein